MTKQFFVLDGENNVLYAGRENDDAPEAFNNFERAEKRAKEAAKAEPGTAFKIVAVHAVVQCPVAAPETRKVA